MADHGLRAPGSGCANHLRIMDFAPLDQDVRIMAEPPFQEMRATHGQTMARYVMGIRRGGSHLTFWGRSQEQRSL